MSKLYIIDGRNMTTDEQRCFNAGKEVECQKIVGIIKKRLRWLRDWEYLDYNGLLKEIESKK